MGGKCNKCGMEFSYTTEEVSWNETGYGYSVKMVKCPSCGYMNVEYIEDTSLDVNNDNRYYEY